MGFKGGIPLQVLLVALPCSSYNSAFTNSWKDLFAVAHWATLHRLIETEQNLNWSMKLKDFPSVGLQWDWWKIKKEQINSANILSIASVWCKCCGLHSSIWTFEASFTCKSDNRRYQQVCLFMFRWLHRMEIHFISRKMLQQVTLGSLLMTRVTIQHVSGLILITVAELEQALASTGKSALLQRTGETLLE